MLGVSNRNTVDRIFVKATDAAQCKVAYCLLVALMCILAIQAHADPKINPTLVGIGIMGTAVLGFVLSRDWKHLGKKDLLPLVMTILAIGLGLGMCGELPTLGRIQPLTAGVILGFGAIGILIYAGYSYLNTLIRELLANGSLAGQNLVREASHGAPALLRQATSALLRIPQEDVPQITPHEGPAVD